MSVSISHNIGWAWSDHVSSGLRVGILRVLTYSKIVILHLLLTIRGVPHRISFEDTTGKTKSGTRF
jgi:hypothetical protein